MTSSNHVIFIESPSVEDLLHQRSEAAVISRLLTLFEVRSHSFTCHTASELLTAARLAGSSAPRVVHVSGHGTSDGFGLSLANGETLPWQRFLAEMSLAGEQTMLVTSACDAIKNRHMSNLLLSMEHPPKGVIGFDQVVTWGTAGAAIAAIYPSLLMGKNNDIYAAMAGTYLSHDANLAIVQKADFNPKAEPLTGKDMLHLLCQSLTSGDRATFESLVTKRGLLSADWTKYWEDRDSRRKQLQAARDNVDLTLAKFGWSVASVSTGNFERYNRLIDAAGHPDGLKEVRRVLDESSLTDSQGNSEH